jgi:L-lactate dehydrogenase
VCAQVYEPALFGGEEEFRRQTEWVAQRCRATPPRPGCERVRLPGEAGLRKRAVQLPEGIELHAAILPALEPWARRFDLPLPAPI